MRGINFSRSAAEAQRKLPAKHRRQIAEKITALLTDIQPPIAKSLKGYDDLWRIRCGEYRIVYRYDAQMLYIELIGKRNDDEIYRALKRLY